MCLECGITSEIVWIGLEDENGKNVGVICERCCKKIFELRDPDSKIDELINRASQGGGGKNGNQICPRVW